MAAPSRHVQRLRGQILHEGESVLLASRVQALAGTDESGERLRGRFLLARTDSRLLLVTYSMLGRGSAVRLDLAADEAQIRVRRPKVGNQVIVVDRAGAAEPLELEWVAGHRARRWAEVRYRH